MKEECIANDIRKLNDTMKCVARHTLVKHLTIVVNQSVHIGVHIYLSYTKLPLTVIGNASRFNIPLCILNPVSTIYQFLNCG